MDAYSSGEELVIKTRKPYTITKQRERWTEEDHNRFLEALKLYGRAWQRIEEHIGTKTAVQIRSHAQKFFSKLEKEALVKGVPIGQAIDIEIPPPRPKRKPSNPYPRKSGAASSLNTQVRVKDGKPVPSGSSHLTDKVLDLEKQPLPEKTAGDNGKQNAKKNSHNDKCTETSAVFQAAHSNVAASANENSAITTEATRTSCNFKESMPTKKQLIDIGGSDSGSADGPTRNHKANNPDTVDAVEDTENEMQAAKNIPRHAPIQILDGSVGACSQAFSTDVSHQESAFRQMRIPGHPTLFSNSAVSAAVESQNSTSRSTHDQMFPSFHPPLTPFPNSQEHYSSYLQMSSTLSSLIVSALLQNPAAHAAATFAASFWPSTNMERSTNCPGTNGGFPPRPINTAPSMAAIAAATVAAATAWWAAHGLLPMCAPPHAGFSCPVSVTAPSTNVAQATNQEREENNFQKTCLHDQPSDQELSDALQPQHSASKSSATSSSNSGNSSGAKMKISLPDIDNEKKVPAVTEQKESSKGKGKGKKQVDRSSCGSNTPSGSDIETDALEKNDKTKEEAKEPDASHPANDISNRCNRIAGNMNDSWKEVSEGGRMAFQALFSREVLPQSFSPPHNIIIIRSMNKEKNVGIEENMQNAEESNENVSQLDLNNNTWESCSSGQDLEKNGFKENDGKDGLLTIGLQGKLKTQKTGFKPYKRCSVEARECRVNSSSQDQESCSKRLRLEGETST